MIRGVLLTEDSTGRQIIDTRVIDIDRRDGLSRRDRVNAAIDLMVGAARDNGLRIGRIGVAATGIDGVTRLASSGPRRRIHLYEETDAIAEQLGACGEIDRYGSVLVVDLGETGMSLYHLDVAAGRIDDSRRSAAIAGVELDRRLARELGTRPAVARIRKETTAAADHRLRDEVVADAAEPMVTAAVREIDGWLRSAPRSRPEVVVLVGGLAHLPVMADSFGELLGLPVVVPDDPHLVAALGAARLARRRTIATGRLVSIGGRRHREWLSAAPLAIAAAGLIGVSVTAYAVAATLVETPEPAPAVTSESVNPAVDTTVPDGTGSSRTTAETGSDDEGRETEPSSDGEPRWATTRLPEQPTAPPTTITLVPVPDTAAPVEEVPVPEGGAPAEEPVPEDVGPEDVGPEDVGPEETVPEEGLPEETLPESPSEPGSSGIWPPDWPTLPPELLPVPPDFVEPPLPSGEPSPTPEVPDAG